MRLLRVACVDMIDVDPKEGSGVLDLPDLSSPWWSLFRRGERIGHRAFLCGKEHWLSIGAWF